MDKLKKIIDLKPLSDEEIKTKNFSLIDLWMVKDEHDNVYGPFDTDSLRVFTGNQQHLFENTKTYNLENEQWFDTFAITHFQRRKPSLVSNQNLIASNEFFISINGQTNGPYTKEEVQAFLNNGQIVSTTQLSLDKGQSWIKLYEHHAFDRRTTKSNQELPFRPAAEILEKMAMTKEEIVKAKEKEEAIIELAFLGHKKPKEKKSATKKYDSDEEIPSSFFSKFKSPLIASFTVCFIAVLGFALFSSPYNGENLIKEAKTDKKSINNAPRHSNRKPASAARVKPQNKIKKIVRKSPRRAAPKRYRPKPAPRRQAVKRTPRKKLLEQEIEKLDINDPEVQDEITRQLSGEFDLDGEEFDENEEDGREFDEPGEDGELGREEHQAEDY